MLSSYAPFWALPKFYLTLSYAHDFLFYCAGCGFVGFSHRYMAVAAINGLDGTYVMRVNFLSLS